MGSEREEQIRQREGERKGRTNQTEKRREKVARTYQAERRGERGKNKSDREGL